MPELSIMDMTARMIDRSWRRIDEMTIDVAGKEIKKRSMFKLPLVEETKHLLFF